jgi:hypothetical protein
MTTLFLDHYVIPIKAFYRAFIKPEIGEVTMAKNILKIETMDASDPNVYTEEIVPATELAERFPQFKGIIDHKDFYKLEYTIDVYRVRITFHDEAQEEQNV